MIQKQVNPKLVDVQAFKINVFKQQQFLPEVFAQSPNQEFFVLETFQRIYLIDKKGKTLLHIVASIYTFDFSLDNRFFAVLFKNPPQPTIFILFNLQTCKALWVRKFEEMMAYHPNQILILRDYLLVVLIGGIKKLNFDGETIQQLQLSEKYRNQLLLGQQNNLIIKISHLWTYVKSHKFLSVTLSNSKIDGANKWQNIKEIQIHQNKTIPLERFHAWIINQQ